MKPVAFIAPAQRGVALIAVLWLVAAMGLIITGIVKSVRVELQIAGQQRHALLAGASADAALWLTLARLHAQATEPPASTQTLQIQFEDKTIPVTITPLNGLINLNQAPEPLLAALYQHAAGLPPPAALALATATIDARQAKSPKGSQAGFDAPEDLLKIPQLSYALYAKISPLVSTESIGGSGLINPLAAPLGVLVVLTSGDLARAQALLARRTLEPTTVDPTFLKAEFTSPSATRSLRLQARIGSPNGGFFITTWHVFLSPDPRTGLPWRLLSSQQNRQAAPSPAQAAVL